MNGTTKIKALSARRMALLDIRHESDVARQMALLIGVVQSLAIDVEALQNKVTCQSCGAMLDVDLLDAKPEFMANSWLVRRLPERLVKWLYWWAAETGKDFDRMECRGCYGPGYMEPH